MTLTPEFIALQEALMGRFSLERELGRGGMGVVYLARDVKLDRPVAIKVLHAAQALRPEARARFVREAQTAARLAHPHIIPIYSVENRDDVVLIVMAMIDGETLGARLRAHGPLPPDDAERVFREIAWALGYAHASGVVHRDLTLENVLIEKRTGRALLVDFGLAGEFHGDDAQLRFGTPGYLAPEVIRGEPASPASDLYALGVVGWTALAGKAPFQADTPAQLLAKHLVQMPPALAAHARGASRRFITAIEACLHKEQSDRPADAAVLLAMLERAPEPVAIAPALEEWFTRFDRIRNMYALATPILAGPFVAMLWMFSGKATAPMINIVSGALITLLSVPIALHLAAEGAAMRRLYSRGFGIGDIRSAYPHWRQHLEVEVRREGLPPLPGRVVFDLTVIGIFLLAAAFVAHPLMRHFWKDDPGVAQYFMHVIRGFAQPLMSATVLGIAINFASPGFRFPAGGRFKLMVEGFWRTSLGAGFALVSSFGQRKRVAASTTLHRNTELVLGLAVDDLWDALPAALRQGLGDVPALAHTLQRSATELRDLVSPLQASEAQLRQDGSELAGLTVTRETIESRHRETVAALERIRLQLLRLVATRQQSVELTQHLLQARELEQALIRDLAAHQEVRNLIRSQSRASTLNSLTPTPTPAPV